MLEIECRGRVDRAGIRQVDGIGALVLAVSADEQHVFALAVYGEVAGEAQGVEDVESVAVDPEASGTYDFSENVNGEVQELNCNNRVFDLVAINQELLDALSGLLAGESGHLDPPENWEIDIALAVDGICGDALGRR